MVDVVELHKAVLSAHARIQHFVQNTPLEYSPFLSKDSQGSVYIKLENEQVTGSFKVRGAFNKLQILLNTSDRIKEHGPITASTGNHAMACNLAMKKLGVEGVIFVPETTAAGKRDYLKMVGANLQFFGTDCMEAEGKARSTAEAEGCEYISPYNDVDVMAGQGTIGIEILKALPEVDVVLASVGGGGLIGGIAAYIKTEKPDCTVIGCQPQLSKVMYESIKAGKIVFEESGDTLSDGTSGGIEENSVTFEVCRKLVDDWIMVTEEEIEKAVFFMVDKHHKIVEGAAGVALGAFMKCASRFKGQNVAIVSCGANIGTHKLQYIINKYSPVQK